MQPKSAHDEKELHSDRSKGQKSTNDGTPGISRVPLLFWNETRNLIGFGGNLDPFRAEAKVAADKDERCGNARPQEKDGYDGENRYGSGSSDQGEEDVEDQEYGHESAWQGDCRGNGVALPCFGVAKLVEACRDVSCYAAAENVEENDGSERSTFVHGVDDFEDSADEGEDEGGSYLRSRARGDAEKQGRGGRRAEDVSVHELPAGLLLRVFEVVELVVESDVVAQGADHDGGSGSSEEEHDHDGIDDGEDVHVIVGTAH
mmetsp:Transcript_25471/g.38140  ORF Transcript_25471/g.38140 Transcript_25471/m.38140 type:complete len:260 (+) Transcript_25471:560-1339(+)